MFVGTEWIASLTRAEVLSRRWGYALCLRAAAAAAVTCLALLIRARCFAGNEGPFSVVFLNQIPIRADVPSGVLILLAKSCSRSQPVGMLYGNAAFQ